MKHFLLTLLCSLYVAFAFGQKEAAIWYFGQNAGLDFNSGVPLALTNGELNTVEGCASISDSDGNLLFYTDGVRVWDRTHQVMPNGTGLYGHSSSTQSAIVVPRPNMPDRYYIFTVDQHNGVRGLNYSELDMTLNGGLGDITALKNSQLITPISEKITAVKHANNRDIWVITHGKGNDTFLSYLVSPTGVGATPIISNVGINLGDYEQWLASSIGYLKASPDGTKLLAAYHNVASELLSFNTLTGVVSNAITLSQEMFVKYYGVEFSPNSRMLYVTEGLDLVQYDSAAPDIPGSAVLIYSFPVYPQAYALQLAIDGKIYMTREAQPFLDVINNPNALGLACNHQQQAIDLQGGLALSGLPPFIQSYFLISFNAANFCFGDATEFSVNASGTISHIEWDFGDGNASSIEQPSHVYAAPGTYTVNVTVTTASETKTESKDITIYPAPIANIITDFEVCSVLPNHEFDLATKNTEILGSQLAAENTIAYYPTLTDAENGTDPLPFLYTNLLSTETIHARITNINNSVCYALTSFDLLVKQAPVLSPVTDWVVCDTDLDGFHTFNLTQKNVEVLGEQDPALFSVSYYETLTDAQAGTSPLGATYTNTVASHELFFRLENTGSPDCFVTGSFLLEVVTGVTATAPPDLEICDDNNDGFFLVNLSLQNAAILGAQSPIAHTVSYHTTLADAEAGINALDALGYTNTLPYQETLYVRVITTSNSDCYATTQFDLRIYDSPLEQPVSPWLVCDVDNDGLHNFDLSEKDSEILGGQSTNDVEVAYFINEADALAGQNPILGSFQNSSNPQQLFYRIQNRNNAACFITDSFSLQIFDEPVAFVSEPLILCDTNGIGILSIDLSSQDVEVLGGQDPNYYVVSYFSSEQDATTNTNVLSKQNYNNTELQETLFARIQHRELTSCYEVTHFSLTINPLLIPALQEVYVICPDSPELVLDGGDFESWVWEDSGGTVVGTSREFNVAALGDYSLTVSQTNDGVRCENTLFFEVVSSGAPEAFIAGVEGFSDQVAISIEVTGIGNFEYSIDGENYQDQARFVVFPGEYTVYVRDKLLCRTLSKEVIALGYQKFFTPNGDDLHEHWNVIGADSFPEAELYIYDRYGKLVQQLTPADPGWDGTFKGTPLPSSDYWFRFVYGNGKVFSGHFSLKR